MSSEPQARKGRGGNKVPSRQALYSKVAVHADEALNALVDLLKSNNEAIRLGAAKVLFCKILPDAKAVEITNPEESALTVRIIAEREEVGGYINPSVQTRFPLAIS